jgi:uncharacterized protein (TIGR02186 family)
VTAPMRLVAGSLAALGLLCSPACAVRLIATVAPSKISITANYSGGHIVVFGAIADRKTPSRSYDAAVTVTGPRQDLIVRRKERILGIWINRSSRTYISVPSYLAISSNRPVDTIASAETLRFQRIGLDHSVFLDESVDQDDPFQTNFIKARIDNGLYVEQPRGVSFVSPTVFRAEIPLPKSALIGDYNVDMEIFADGTPVAKTSSTFHVEKIGLAQFVVTSSLDHSLLYGLATMGMALLTGWIASIAFRRG